MSKEVVYVVSNLQKSLAFEWIGLALRDKFNLSFVLLNALPSPLEEFLRKNNIYLKRIEYSGKKDFIVAFIKLFFYFLLKRPAIVHVHLFDAQLIGLSAAWLAGVDKRIYTRHNSNYHQVYFPKGVRYDKWSNLVATHIISISQSTHKTLTMLESVSEKKIRNIHHGFDLSVFRSVSEERKQFMFTKWKIPQNSPCIVGVIARHIEWKGIQYIIPAFGKFLSDCPSAVLVLANASGPYHKVLMNLLAEIPQANYVLVPFEEDVATLYSLFHIYVHTPVDRLSEAFGQTYVEALAAGVPSIFTPSGVAAEFIVHGKNALVVDFKNADQIYDALLSLFNDPELRNKLIQAGYESVKHTFDLKKMIDKLEKLYAE